MDEIFLIVLEFVEVKSERKTFSKGYTVEDKTKTYLCLLHSARLHGFLCITVGILQETDWTAVGRSCPSMLSSILASFPLTDCSKEAMVLTIKNLFRHCKVTFGDKIISRLEALVALRM